LARSKKDEFVDAAMASCQAEFSKNGLDFRRRLQWSWTAGRAVVNLAVSPLQMLLLLIIGETSEWKSYKDIQARISSKDGKIIWPCCGGLSKRCERSRAHVCSEPGV